MANRIIPYYVIVSASYYIFYKFLMANHLVYLLDRATSQKRDQTMHLWLKITGLFINTLNKLIETIVKLAVKYVHEGQQR